MIINFVSMKHPVFLFCKKYEKAQPTLWSALVFQQQLILKIMFDTMRNLFKKVFFITNRWCAWLVLPLPCLRHPRLFPPKKNYYIYSTYIICKMKHPQCRVHMWNIQKIFSTPWETCPIFNINQICASVTLPCLGGPS